MNILAIFILLGATSAMTFALLPFLIPRLIKYGITGLDIHKPDKPVRAEMGGASILLASLVGLILAYPLLDPLSLTFFAAFSTVVLVGIVGMIDDVVGLRQRYKPFLVAIASVPLIYVLWGRASINFPLIGSIPFGLLYPLLIVPLAVTTSANFSNILAGFNGLEAGTASIAIAALTFLSWIRGQYDASLIGIIFLGGYLAFLKYNWYPAKAFPGDTGTLMSGAVVAAIGLVGGLEFAAIVVTMPAAIDFTLKMLHRRPFAQREIFGNTTVGSDGRLIPPSYPALAHAFMNVSPMSERSLVKSILIMEMAYALLAILVTQFLM
jgi:UDP-N-acetylglucosamine--dolichyl-phosphate N-acetylglucosaminephosphotransferase